MKSIEVDKIQVDGESDDDLDYQEDDQRNSLNSGSDLSKKRIIIRNKFNQSSTQSKALGKLKERYAPGSIKRLRKATID